MSYEPINWKNGKTPISAENLNHMEQGIKAMHDVLFSSGYTIRQRVSRSYLTSGASWIDGKPKKVANKTLVMSDGSPLYLLSAGVYLSDEETVDDTVMYTGDNVFCRQYTAENGEIRFAIRAEYDEDPKKYYAYFRIVYLQGTDVENEIPAIVEEITDARKGRDGTVYNSLGEAIRTQVAGGVESLTWNDLWGKTIRTTIVEEKDYDFTYNAELGLYYASVDHVAVFNKNEEVIAYINYDYNYGKVTEDADGYDCCDPDNLLNGEKPEYMTFALYRPTGGGYTYDMYIYDPTGGTDSTKNFTISVATRKTEYHYIYPWHLDQESVVDRLLPSTYEKEDGMHLVIENGKWVAKEFEATGGSERTVILEEQTVEGFGYQSSLGVYFCALTPSPCVLELGKEYTVEWDGTEYTGTTFVFNNGESDLVAIGNTLLAGGEDTGVPFAVAYNSETSYLNMFAMTTENSHTLAIYQDVSNELPEVSTDDNGKILQVVNGKWTAVAITDGNEVAY